jgi:hypothetical protein
MVNSAEDFGETAKSMVIGLVTNKTFDIIDTQVENDND